MRTTVGWYLRDSVWLLLVVLSLQGVALAQGTRDGRSADSLVDILNEQWAHSDTLFTFTCGQAGTRDQEDRRVTRSLVRLGSSAMPAILKALDSVERRGRESEWDTNSEWLLYADAAVEGPGALQRLERMIRDPKLRFLHSALTNAIANSLGLTSYVDEEEAPLHRICREMEPKNALDDLVFAWENGDGTLLESKLGPTASNALTYLRKGQTLDPLRPELLKSKSAGSVAVGYRLDVEGSWSKPFGALTDVAQTPPPTPSRFDLTAIWTNASGNECGRSRVSFLRLDRSPNAEYRIDNTDIGELLHAISFCAVQFQEPGRKTR